MTGERRRPTSSAKPLAVGAFILAFLLPPAGAGLGVIALVLAGTQDREHDHGSPFAIAAVLVGSVVSVGVLAALVVGFGVVAAPAAAAAAGAG